VPLRPPEVHPEEHLGPVGRLGPARAGIDADERPALVVLAGEEEGRPFTGEVGREGVCVAVELGGKLRVAGLLDEGDELDEVVGALAEVVPEGDLGAEAVGLAEDALRRALVVPEAGSSDEGVELRDARLFGG
jgi:hypothetical protein